MHRHEPPSTLITTTHSQQLLSSCSTSVFMQMGKKSRSTLARRAWRMLRLALLWARKGRVVRRKLMLDLHLAVNHLRKLKAGGRGDSDRLHYYNEREFSFEETPAFRFKLHSSSSMRLPRFPCINPVTSFDDDDNLFEDDENVFEFARREEYGHEDVNDDDDDGRNNGEITWKEEEEEEGVDSKAEEFIAKFYEQMKLQRQASLLEHNEMLHRSL